MTLASNLFDTSGSNSYVAGDHYDLAPSNVTGNVTADYLYCVPFTVRKNVTIDRLYWERTNTTAGNVYIAVIDSDGVTQTDCAVEAGTTAGIYWAATTPAELTTKKNYIWCVTASAGIGVRLMSVTGGGNNAAGYIGTSAVMAAGKPYLYASMGSSPAFYISRTAAAITGTIDLSSPVTVGLLPWGGFRAA